MLVLFSANRKHLTMYKLLTIEFDKAFRNFWFCAALLIGCAIACSSAAISIFNYYDWKTLDSGMNLSLGTSGSFSAWIGCGTLDLTTIRDLFFTVAPLLAVIPYAWSLSSEFISGAIIQPYTRSKRLQYLIAKYAATFCTGGIAIAAPLLLNFVVISCFIPGYMPDAGEGLRVPIMADAPFSYLYYNAPIIYVFAYTAHDFTLCGAWAIFVMTLSFFIDNRVILMVTPFIAQYALAYLTGIIFKVFDDARPFSFSIIDLVNPVAGFTADLRITGILVIGTLALSVLVCLWQIRKDVL